MFFLMKCGHVAQGALRDGKPVCAICAGIDPGAEIVERPVVGTDGLEGRQAVCCYHCGKKATSAWALPFFEYRPDQPVDKYYCGCMGWD